MTRHDTALPTPERSRGFVLVTSLVFLVVVTLLAVSAINSSTVQETMASNLREKSRARQASDAALRHGELLLENAAFDTYQAPDSTVTLASQKEQGSEGQQNTLKIWMARGMLSNSDDDDTMSDAEENAAFLDDRLWSNTAAATYLLDNNLADTRYYIEDYDLIPRDLNPDTAAVGDGAVLYRITAHARGQKPTAVAVTQSLYEKHY